MIYVWASTKMVLGVGHTRQNRNQTAGFGFIVGPADRRVASNSGEPLRVRALVYSQHAHFPGVLDQDHTSCDLGVAKGHDDLASAVTSQHMPAGHDEAEPGVHMHDESRPT